MQQRTLGVGLKVSAIGYGAMGLSHAYGNALPKDEAIKVLRSAIDQGYSLIDTAALYVGQFADGSPAINEELVGQAIKPVREQITLATKGGVRFENGQPAIDGRSESLRRSLETSLRQLGVDSIDLYYQHMQDPKVEPEVVAETMKQFIKEGKIRHWGISNASADYVERANAVTHVTAFQGRFSMLSRGSAKMFPMLQKHHIGFVAYSPLANGFLTNQEEKINKGNQLDFRNVMHQYTTAGAAEAEDITTLINRLAQEKKATPAQISLAWVLSQGDFIVPIPGTSKISRMAENAKAASIELTADEVKQMNTLLDQVDYEQYEQRPM